MRKRSFIVALAAAVLCMGLVGCSGGLTANDATVYVQGLLDKTYLGKYNKDYMELVDVMDKAGSYAFQEHGEMIISSVRGDTDNVIGLPVRDVMKCLNGLGYRV